MSEDKILDPLTDEEEVTEEGLDLEDMGDEELDEDEDMGDEDEEELDEE